MQHDLFIHFSGNHGYYLHAGGTDIMVKGINRDEVNYIKTWYTMHSPRKPPADLDFLLNPKS